MSFFNKLIENELDNELLIHKDDIFYDKEIKLSLIKEENKNKELELYLLRENNRKNELNKLLIDEINRKNKLELLLMKKNNNVYNDYDLI